MSKFFLEKGNIMKVRVMKILVRIMENIRQELILKQVNM